MKRIITTAVLAAALAGCGQTIHLGEPSLAETDLMLPAPESHCSLSEVNPSDRELMAEQIRLQRGQNYVLGMFADCGELIAWRQGRDGLGQFGSYLSPVNTHGRRLPMARQDFVRQIANEFNQNDHVGSAANSMRKELVEAEMSVELGETVSLGLLATDDIGAYIGVLQRISDETGEEAEIAAITGLTLVQGRVVTVNLWAPYDGQRSVEALLSQQRKALRQLIRANRG